MNDRMQENKLITIEYSELMNLFNIADQLIRKAQNNYEIHLNRLTSLMIIFLYSISLIIFIWISSVIGFRSAKAKLTLNEQNHDKSQNEKFKVTQKRVNDRDFNGLEESEALLSPFDRTEAERPEYSLYSDIDSEENNIQKLEQLPKNVRTYDYRYLLNEDSVKEKHQIEKQNLSNESTIPSITKVNQFHHKYSNIFMTPEKSINSKIKFKPIVRNPLNNESKPFVINFDNDNEFETINGFSNSYQLLESQRSESPVSDGNKTAKKKRLVKESITTDQMSDENNRSKSEISENKSKRFV
jgi:hypothetical protein